MRRGSPPARASAGEIEAIAEIQRLRSEEPNPTREFRVRTNRQFHDAIINAARNARLADAIYRTGRFYFNERIAASGGSGDFAANQADHDKIVEALRAGGVEKLWSARRGLG